MTQSVPSSTALATSVASARVGRGFLVIDSSICGEEGGSVWVGWGGGVGWGRGGGRFGMKFPLSEQAGI